MNKLVRLLLLVIFALASAQIAAAATYVVTKIADTNDGVCDSDCSLREAISAANAGPDDDVIEFDPAVFNTQQTIVLSGAEMIVANNGSLTISGPGASLLTLDGNLTSRIISVSPGVTLSMSGITFTRGNGQGATNNNTGGAIMNNAGFVTLTDSVVTRNQTSGVSGGIRNSGNGSTLTIINSTISNNTAGSSGGGVQSFNTSTITVINSTISGNTNNGGVGGGLMIAGQGHIINSTITGNTSNGTGAGGVNSTGTMPFTMTNSTVVGNTSLTHGGGLNRGSTNPSGFIRNSIIAGNNGVETSPDVSNSDGGLNSLGNNIIGDVGTSSGWVESDLLDEDPLLSPLGFYGGGNFTYIPLVGSPAIDGGQNCVTDLSCDANNPPIAITMDQREAVRPSGVSVDIGAVEISNKYIADLGEIELGVPYQRLLVPISGGTNFSVTDGTLPPGIILDVDSFTTVTEGEAPGPPIHLTGTPTQSGTFSFTITMIDGKDTASVPYILTVLGEAANVSVGGRVFNSSGNGLWNALVKLDDGNGNIRYAATSTFGYYRFDDVPTGGPYTVSVASRMFDFNPQTVKVTGQITDLDFMPE